MVYVALYAMKKTVYAMVESIRKNGILEPLLVRALPDGKYYVLAGNNRGDCGNEAGLSVFPCIVKENITDDEAQMYIDETNIMQRGFTSLKISKQAEVIARRHSAMFDAEKREAIVSELKGLENSPLGNSQSKSKLEAAGEEYGLSRNSVARLVRINTLIDVLKKWVDSKDISVRAAVELSYISPNAQIAIAEKHTRSDKFAKLDIKLAKKYRAAFEGFDGTSAQAANVLAHINDSKKAAAGAKKSKNPINIAMPCDTYSRYFKENTAADEVADTISKALEMYFNHQSNNDTNNTVNSDELNELNLSVKTYNAVCRQGLKTISELMDLACNIADLQSIFGVKSADEILNALKKFI